MDEEWSSDSYYERPPKGNELFCPADENIFLANRFPPSSFFGERDFANDFFAAWNMAHDGRHVGCKAVWERRRWALALCTIWILTVLFQSLLWPSVLVNFYSCKMIQLKTRAGHRQNWQSRWQAILNGSQVWADESHSDQELLRKFVWPFVQHSASFYPHFGPDSPQPINPVFLIDQWIGSIDFVLFEQVMQHDAFFCDKFPEGSKGFPTQRIR